VLGRDRRFQTMALAFGAKPALPHPFVEPYASGGVPNVAGTSSEVWQQSSSVRHENGTRPRVETSCRQGTVLPPGPI
jgi:hypothetical protein